MAIVLIVHCRSAKLQNIERLLLIAERYILAVEESHTVARTIFPHGASFQGYPVTMNIVCDSPKMEFTIQVRFAWKDYWCFISIIIGSSQNITLPWIHCTVYS